MSSKRCAAFEEGKTQWWTMIIGINLACAAYVKIHFEFFYLRRDIPTGICHSTDENFLHATFIRMHNVLLYTVKITVFVAFRLGHT